MDFTHEWRSRTSEPRLRFRYHVHLSTLFAFNRHNDNRDLLLSQLSCKFYVTIMKIINMQSLYFIILCNIDICYY